MRTSIAATLAEAAPELSRRMRTRAPQPGRCDQTIKTVLRRPYRFRKQQPQRQLQTQLRRLDRPQLRPPPSQRRIVKATTVRRKAAVAIRKVPEPQWAHVRIPLQRKKEVIFSNS